eukprot:365219-Chlamydomonas_euryale.AAC.12
MQYAVCVVRLSSSMHLAGTLYWQVRQEEDAFVNCSGMCKQGWALMAECESVQTERDFGCHTRCLRCPKPSHEHCESPVAHLSALAGYLLVLCTCHSSAFHRAGIQSCCPTVNSP